jgi:prephenate dehydrogenase
MKIAIIGLGLIGGSWARALREWAKTDEGRGANIELVGFDAKGNRRSEASKMNLCHSYTATPMDAVKGADYVIVATPVMAVRDTFEDIAEHLKAGAVVTDTSSTKRLVMQWAKEILPRTVHFVGGHPMAGKTASLEEASAVLFKDCTYCLMAAPNVSEEALDSVVHLVQSVGAKPFFMDPVEHDSYVAAISHLPHLASVGLVNLSGDSEGWREMSRLASTGFQDTTRLAGGNIPMYFDIYRTNSDSVASWIDRYIQVLLQLKEQVQEVGMFDERGRLRTEIRENVDEEENVSDLQKSLVRALETRERWLTTRANPEGNERTVVPMPTRDDLKNEYSRMVFGGLFTKKKRPDDKKGDK